MSTSLEVVARTSGRSTRSAFSAFASSGVNARSACCTRLPSWASTSAGTSFGRLRHEEDADALGPDQPHGLRDRVEELLRRAVEQQVRLVEEEHQLRLVEVADLGQVLEQVGEQPHEERREQRGPVLHRRAARGS